MDALRRCRIPDEERPLSIAWEAIDPVPAAPDEQQPMGWAPIETGTVFEAEQASILGVQRPLPNWGEPSLSP